MSGYSTTREAGITAMKRIAFFIARHSRTGVPLAQLRLARALATRGYHVDFVVGYVPEDIDPPASPGINVIVLNRSRTLGMFPHMVKYLRAARPDIVFSAEDHMNAITAFAAVASGVKTKISASSRITPRRVYRAGAGVRPKLDALLHRLSRRRIDVLTCVSSDMACEYESIFGGGRYRTVYNIVFDGDSERRMAEPVEDEWFTDSPTPIIVSAGTLTRRKGFDILINAVALVSRHRPVRLAILGEGHQRPALQSLVDAHGLSGCVRLLGTVDNPLKYFKASDVFVLSSYAEGLPNVLVEAMSAGCTVVSTNCPTGPAEVLQDGKNGFLVPMGDAAAMAEAILDAIDNPTSPAVLDRAIDAFRENAVITAHRDLLGF